MNIFITDGTLDGFFSAAFTACTDRNCIVTSQPNLQLSLDAHIIEVKADHDKCKRVRKKIDEYDSEALNDIRILLKRGSPDKEMTALNYLRLLIQEKRPIRDMLAVSAVRIAMEERRKVTLEAHRFTGFLRFMESEGGIFYAPFSPDNDILELILPHFYRRFANQPFVIHDISRRKAALCFKGKSRIVTVDDGARVLLHEDELCFQSLWQQYYRSVNIDQRPHEKQMKGYMPVRYWKYMPEKQQEIFSSLFDTPDNTRK